jgi:hypothetical protein
MLKVTATIYEKPCSMPPFLHPTIPIRLHHEINSKWNNKQMSTLIILVTFPFFFKNNVSQVPASLSCNCQSNLAQTPQMKTLLHCTVSSISCSLSSNTSLLTRKRFNRLSWVFNGNRRKGVLGRCQHLKIEGNPLIIRMLTIAYPSTCMYYLACTIQREYKT